MGHWSKEISGQREIMHLYGGVKLEDIRGMRAPFLQVGGNSMFEMLYHDNFTYDSSMPVLDNNPPFYPYTLDYSIGHECMIPPCPTKSFPGLWEVSTHGWHLCIAEFAFNQIFGTYENNKYIYINKTKRLSVCG